MHVNALSVNEREALHGLSHLLFSPPPWNVSGGPDCNSIGVRCLPDTAASLSPSVLELNLTQVVRADLTFFSGHFLWASNPSNFSFFDRSTFPLLELLSLASLSWTGPVSLDLPSLRTLDLSQNSFDSLLSPALVQLPKLEHLLINSYAQEGWFTRIGQMSDLDPILCFSSSLETLISQNNLFTHAFSPCLWGLSNLTVLDLAHNKLSEPFSNQLTRLQRLEVLDLSDNAQTLYFDADAYVGVFPLSKLRTLRISSLPRGFPTALSQLSFFETFEFKVSSLTNLAIQWGPYPCLPAEISHFPSLRNLVVSGIPCGGTISQNIGSLTTLETLDLSRTHLEGPIPESISELTRLAYFDISGTQVNPGVDFPDPFCRPDSSLQTLKLDYMHSFHDFRPHPTNMGPLPLVFSDCLKLETLSVASDSLFLDAFVFNGTIPESYCRLTQLRSVNLNSNRLQGSFKPLTCAHGLIELKLGWNHLDGTIPEEISHWVNLTDLLLLGNNLTGTIPNSIGMLRCLTEILLPDQRLEGAIPGSIGDLESLKTLEIPRNSLTGTLPPSLARLTHLERLQLQGNRLHGSLASVDWTTNPALRDIWLSDNNFTSGLEPDSFFVVAMANLSIVDVAENQLISPFSWSWLANSGVGIYTSLYFQKNLISGQIPPPPADLFVHTSTSAYFSNNFLTGTIPPSICNINTSSSGLRIFLDGNALVPPFPHCCTESYSLKCTIYNYESAATTTSTATSTATTTLTATLATTTTFFPTTNWPSSTPATSMPSSTPATYSNTGTVIGIVLSSIALLSLAIGWILFNCYRYRRSDADPQSLDPVMRFFCQNFGILDQHSGYSLPLEQLVQDGNDDQEGPLVEE